MPELSLRCSVCRSLLDEEDLFCPNCGTESPKPEQTARAGEAGRTATCNFQCAGCGASMSYDASAGSLRCPFCASVELVPQKDAKILSPRRVVPFAVGRDAAVSAMRGWLGRGFFRPGNLAAQAAVVQMQPVYVPYWVFEARTHTHWTADTDRTPPGARANWYPLAGEHRGSYAGLLIGASGALQPRETANLCPFDLAAGVPPEQVDLDNITVEQFSVPRKYARPLAEGGLEQLESEACTSAYVPGRARNVHANVLIDGMSSEPVLLPVWIMAYRYKDRVFRFLVNGQSGRATGSAPVSWLKVAMIPAIILAAILLVLLLFGIFGGSGKPKPRPFHRVEAPGSESVACFSHPSTCTASRPETAAPVSPRPAGPRIR